MFKNRDRIYLKDNRGISIQNTYSKIYSKILNTNLQNYSERFVTETKNGF
jgi:hypothetical protein